MINLKQGRVLLGLLLAAWPPLSVQALPPLNPKPFISADVGYRDLDFQDGYGSEVFKSSLPQTGLQVGMRLWEYFGFQFGYERTRREGRTSRIGPGEMVLGRRVPLNGTEHHTTESGIQGGYFDILFFVPSHPMTQLELLLGIGVVRTKLLHEDVIVGLNDQTLLAPIPRTFRVKQSHYRVFGGIQKLFKVNNGHFINYAGIRATASWENTSQYKYERPLEIADSFLTAKNSYVFSLGIILSA